MIRSLAVEWSCALRQNENNSERAPGRIAWRAVTLAGFLHVSSVPDQIRYVNQNPLVSLSELSNPLLTLPFLASLSVPFCRPAALTASLAACRCAFSGVEGREVTTPFVSVSHTLRRQICSLILSSSLSVFLSFSSHIHIRMYLLVTYRVNCILDTLHDFLCR